MLTVHDDLRYTLQGSPDAVWILDVLAEAWRDSAVRIVIGEEMGDEYSRRYGERPFRIVTDGFESLSPIASRPAKGSPRSLYFMGLLHQGCLPNLESVLKALALLNSQGEAWRLVARCGRRKLPFDKGLTELSSLLPYGSQCDVQIDMQAAAVLYQPLPFGDQFDDMNRFSLSTKMITYLGSGKPILYHGPENSATGRLLSSWNAAASVHSLDPHLLAQGLQQCVENGPLLAEQAQKLARDRFMLADQRKTFWECINDALASSVPANR